jgi:hypothetical protein
MASVREHSPIHTSSERSSCVPSVPTVQNGAWACAAALGADGPHRTRRRPMCPFGRPRAPGCASRGRVPRRPRGCLGTVAGMGAPMTNADLAAGSAIDGGSAITRPGARAVGRTVEAAKIRGGPARERGGTPGWVTAASHVISAAPGPSYRLQCGRRSGGAETIIGGDSRRGLRPQARRGGACCARIAWHRCRRCWVPEVRVLGCRDHAAGLSARCLP